MALSDKHREFIGEYLKDFNATRAYMAVYPDSSPNAARTSAATLLTNPNVQAALDIERKARSERTQVTNDRVLLEIARLAFGDPRRAFRKNGELLPVHEWPDDVAASISSIKIKQVPGTDAPTEMVEVKFWDKNSALEKAAKHLGMYEADNRQRAAAKTMDPNIPPEDAYKAMIGA